MLQQNEDVRNDVVGFSLFNDIEDTALQAYNRCVVMVNLCKGGKKDIGLEYMRAVPAEGQMKLMAMASYIKENGFEKTIKEIKAGRTFPVTVSAS